MKKWTIVAILGISLLAICLGATVAFLPVARQVVAGNFQWNIFSLRSVSADAIEEHTVEVDGSSDLKVDTPFGRVDVMAVEGSRGIVIEAHKYAWGSSKKAAEESLQKIKVIVKQDGNSVQVSVEQPVQVDIFHIGPSNGSVDFTISVPTDCAVDASSSSGNVSVTGTGGSTFLHSSFGRVSAENIRGGLTAETSSGEVVVKNIQAAGESVKAGSSFGDVLVANVQGGYLKANSSSGEVTVEDSAFSGRADISSNFGDLHVTALDAAGLNARANSGKVDLSGLQIQDDLTAHSDFGDVSVKKSPAQRYDLSTNSGKVTAQDLHGPVKAHSDFGDLVVSGEGVVLDLSTNSGSIEFSGSLGDGVSTLHTNFGDIQILLPADAQFQAALSTSFGDVHCGFPITGNQESNTYLIGKVGEGGPTLNASTNSGNVSVYPQSAE